MTAKPEPTFVRLYHPTLDSWQDVPNGDVKGWTDAGWKAKNPGQVNETGAPPVGEHPGFADIPVLESSTTTTTPVGSTGGTTT